jgi:hypothetical protein
VAATQQALPLHSAHLCGVALWRVGRGGGGGGIAHSVPLALWSLPPCCSGAAARRFVSQILKLLPTTQYLPRRRPARGAPLASSSRLGAAPPAQAWRHWPIARRAMALAG